MPENSADFAPLAKGERAALSFAKDYCHGIEDLPGMFEPGSCSGTTDIDADTIMTEKLAALRCGLIVLQKQVPLFEGAAGAALREEAAPLLELAAHFRRASYPGASSSRFAPFLFSPEKPRADVSANLRATVGSVAKNYTAGEPSFDTIFENGLDDVDANGTASDSGIRLEGQALQDAVAKANELFGRLRQTREIGLGIGEGGFTDFYAVPVFFVGFLPSGRLGGLLAAFID
jgi:hypothetical protein